MPVFGGISGSNKTMLNMMTPQYGLIIGSWRLIGRGSPILINEQLVSNSY
jgi:hypothetical protein